MMLRPIFEGQPWTSLSQPGMSSYPLYKPRYTNQIQTIQDKNTSRHLDYHMLATSFRSSVFFGEVSDVELGLSVSFDQLTLHRDIAV